MTFFSQNGFVCPKKTLKRSKKPRKRSKKTQNTTEKTHFFVRNVKKIGRFFNQVKIENNEKKISTPKTVFLSARFFSKKPIFLKKRVFFWQVEFEVALPQKMIPEFV